MRFIIPAAALALLAFQAQAQTTTPTPAPAATTTAPAAPAPVVKPKHMHRQTLQQRFEAANATKDGHLTKDQAETAKWTYVTRHFAAIDKDSKGFVTVDDIHAYAASTRHAHHHVTAPATAPAAQN
jgi:hypothetical protein